MLKNILKKIRYLELSANNKITSLFSGNYRSAFKGRGLEFADIRPYDLGDDIRDIDWKTSSKQGELYIKTYHESRDNTIFFIIDGTASMHFSSIPQKKYERLLETFSLLAFSAIKNGDKVGILFYDEENIKIFPPKKGKKNVLQILKFCIEKYTNKENNIFKKTNKLIIFKKIFSFLKHSATIFWFSGEIEHLNRQTQKAIKLIILKHDFIPIIFSDPLEEDFSKKGEFTFQDSFSAKIKTIFLNKEISKNFKKIRQIKLKKFQLFFQKQKSKTLFIRAKDNLFKKFYIFFQFKQKMM